MIAYCKSKCKSKTCGVYPVIVMRFEMKMIHSTPKQIF